MTTTTPSHRANARQAASTAIEGALTLCELVQAADDWSAASKVAEAIHLLTEARSLVSDWNAANPDYGMSDEVRAMLNELG